MNNYIYETVVFDGRTKDFRVLNLNTGTVYSLPYKDFDAAVASIIVGEVRGSKTVTYIPLESINNILHDST